MATLRELTKIERGFVDSLKSLQDFVNTFDNSRDRVKIDSRLEYLDTLFNKFLENRAKIEARQEQDLGSVDQSEDGKESDVIRDMDEANRKTRLALQNIYFDVKDFLLSRRIKPTAVTDPSPPPFQSAVSRVHLPIFKIPSFDGSVKDWLSFRDAFQSMIDKDVSLTPVDKFNYLLSVLTKEARTLVESIDVTAANYEVAWKMLQERFENKKIIARTLMDGFLDAEAIKRESYDSLVTLIDSYERNLLQLKKINVDTDNWSQIIAHLLYKRLDADTQRHWERFHKSREIPQYKSLLKFLRDHLTTLQPMAVMKVREQNVRPDSNKHLTKHKYGSTLTTTAAQNKSCPLCLKPYHSPFKCESFVKLNPIQRHEIVKKTGLCLNCLSSSHLVRACPSSACRVCGQMHHTMLHMRTTNITPSQENTSLQTAPLTIPQHRISSIAPIATNIPHSQSQNFATNPAQLVVSPSLPVGIHSSYTRNVVFLSTAIIKIADSHGNMHLARALLDSCSERNLLSARLAQKLTLRRRNDPLSLQGIGPSMACSKQSAVAKIISRCSSFEVDLKFHILPEFKPILPSTRLSISHWNIPTSVVLADPRFFEPSNIDVIIGAEIYHRLLLDGFIELGLNLPILKETVFGWIVSGKCDNTVEHSPAVTMVCSHADLETQINRFWEIESCYSDNNLSVDERHCEQYFAETTTRDSTGRFVVSLPMKETVLLGKSREIALKRFLSLERRLLANPELRKSYSAFIREYIELGHMALVNSNTDLLSPDIQPYYMPHHCVIRPESSTTKLRVVFDASCPTNTGVSLNDTLMVGPVVQDELFNIILRFRLARYVIVADLEKMYRQVLVHPTDRHLQRILWRNNPTDPVDEYELRTVTYGTASAPFLATRCLRQLAMENKASYPTACEVLEKSFYIDDLLCGVATEQKGIELCEQLIDILRSAGFKLHKWASNSPRILNNIPVELKDNRSVFELDSSSPIKTLGLLWQPTNDVFRFKIPSWNDHTIITKRIVLSDAARLFDPLGLVGPIIVRSKIFMQHLWQSKISWDCQLDVPQQQFWKEFRNDLQTLDNFVVPRWVTPCNKPCVIELHGFCDASESAYGACIYLRSITSSGLICVYLLTGKSKVAPKGFDKGQKRICLPRLELSSALLLSHLYEKVKSGLNLNTNDFFWSDSMIVIHWLAASPSRWKKFVGNRVAEIQQITATGIWSHVAGLDNPADAISRGMPASQLMEHTIWWQGPRWLNESSRFWPNLLLTTDDQFDKQLLEEKSSTSLTIVSNSAIFELKSTLTGLVRLVAHVRRFWINAKLKNKNSRHVGPLSTAELDNALQNLVRVAQHESFGEDIRSIRTSCQVKPTSKLKSLSPVLVNGVLRTRGRLNNARVSYDQKQPMILDHNHPLTSLIVRHYHVKFLHAGPQLLCAAIRLKFWPLRLRSLARKVVHTCVNCFRSKPQPAEQIMADLPPSRVNPTLPFLKTGIDFCGPFYLRPLTRKRAPEKCYVAVFVCMSTKALHFELVGNLSTDSFIGALKRFAARRGIPQTIHCDNATNFVGARRVLNEFLQLFRTEQNRNQISKLCSDEGIEFRFIPPRSPHFGGIWEAAVKSLKHHLHRTLANALITAEQMETLLCQIEACLNSRPLTQLSSDPQDLDVLTPGHFLVHRTLTAIPEPSYQEIVTGRLSQWQLIQEFLRQIWRRWSTEYLSDLQQRCRWTKKRNNIRLGTMVLVKEDHLPPMKWRYGRIVDVFPGSDGCIRVVNIRTKDGIFKRAITRICVLPIEDNQQLDVHAA